ncbi:MAG TPA: hypothetical protein VFW46_13035, partial [Stellaceae bacterium]|nr:hypothetical protein [Stellaceae bacterium]
IENQRASNAEFAARLAGRLESLIESYEKSHSAGSELLIAATALEHGLTAPAGVAVENPIEG